MAFNYAEIATIADTILQEFGQAITIIGKTAGAYDPATGSATVATDTSQQGYGAIFDYGSKLIDGEFIKFGDKQLLLSVVGITNVKIGDSAVVDSRTYTITQIKVYNPGGTSVMLECNLRT